MIFVILIALYCSNEKIVCFLIGLRIQYTYVYVLRYMQSDIYVMQVMQSDILQIYAQSAHNKVAKCG